jgi:DNA-binding beta-propeller fold protein YncE
LLFALRGRTAPPTAHGFSGKVLGGGAPIAGSTVTLWAAGSGAPRKVGQTQTGKDGAFSMDVPAPSAGDVTLYVTAQGGKPGADKAHRENPAIALLAVLGDKPPARAIVDEFTTVAGVWTHAQFIEGSTIQGPALGLRIAAGNVPNFVDLETGGYGGVIQDALNSSQTPTMANFGTLSNLLAGCVTQVTENACGRLFEATTTPDGRVPRDTLAAAQFVARNAAYKPERLFGLLDAFYPAPGKQRLRPTPFLPYLSFAPSAWVLPLKFSGGGLSGPGKLMFDSNGNVWTGVNFVVGEQASDAFWNGNLSKFAPNGRPLSPMTTGFMGGGLLGPGFGTAVAADDKVWVTSTSGKTISLFDQNGAPLSPPEGYNLGGQLGIMQGIIVAPDGDVWAIDFGKEQVVHLPKGDPSKGQLLCTSLDGKPEHNPCKLDMPFHLAIDQQDRIWITNVFGDTVTRLAASAPEKVEVFKTGGFSGKGMAIDSQGDAWITNTLGQGLDVETKAKLLKLKLAGDTKGVDRVIVDFMKTHRQGSISMLKPDGSPGPGSPFTAGGSLWAPWGAAIDGNDQVWVSTLAGASLVHLCGTRTETCPSGSKPGDPISPPGGYVGGGMQWLTDVAIDPAGNVWVANNWDQSDSCFGKPPEASSTRCGGNGLTVFYGMAKPVRAPQIGPAQPL